FRVDPFTIRRGLRSRSLTSKIWPWQGVASKRIRGRSVRSKLAEFTFSALALRITPHAMSSRISSQFTILTESLRILDTNHRWKQEPSGSLSEDAERPFQNKCRTYGRLRQAK